MSSSTPLTPANHFFPSECSPNSTRSIKYFTCSSNITTTVKIGRPTENPELEKFSIQISKNLLSIIYESTLTIRCKTIVDLSTGITLPPIHYFKTRTDHPQSQEYCFFFHYRSITTYQTADNHNYLCIEDYVHTDPTTQICQPSARLLHEIRTPSS